MLTKGLLLKLFDAAHMQRWNDRLRPVALFELDKQAHKMIAAVHFARFEQARRAVDLDLLIEGALFEMLQRVVLTDIKPPVFHRIKEDAAKYRQLNDWIYEQLKKYLLPLGDGTADRFRAYFDEPEETIERRILGAAHLFATRWEFGLIERLNTGYFDVEDIRRSLDERLAAYGDLAGMEEIAKHGGNNNSRHFLDLCGQLRFQYRWSNLHMMPRISVLGHMLLVGLVAYLHSREIGACRRRAVNNFLTGLYHDLPEVLTRDIISPVKRSVEGLPDLIKEYEREQMEREVYSLLPDGWRDEFRRYTEDEFSDTALVGGKFTPTKPDEISKKYNDDRFDPRDGSLVKAADELCAFIEASTAIKNGNHAEDFFKVRVLLREKYGNRTVASINFGQIYADFE
ncbi:MAG TPA: HD domain-containing protein [bacterium]|nr:HD domain-containing protein [bacterium]